MARIADCQHIRRNVLRHDASGPDHCIIPDRHARHDNHTGSEPAVLADMYRQIILICLFTQLRQQWMIGGRQHDVRSEHRMISHIDMRIIHTGQPKICIYPITKMDKMAAPVCMKWRFQITVLSSLSKHLLQKLLPLFSFRRPRMIIIIQKLQTLYLLGDNIPAVRIIDFSTVQSFFPSVHCVFSSLLIVPCN